MVLWIAQHVNLAGSGKILLKLTLSAQKSVPESNHTFSFDTPEDREVIKEYLTQKLSSVKSNLVSDGNRKASIIAGNLKKTYPISASEIRARQALLSRDSELKKFHEELVVNGVIEEDQFWESRKVYLKVTTVLFLGLIISTATTGPAAIFVGTKEGLYFSFVGGYKTHICRWSRY